jgi:hypothetical protein
MVKCDFCRSEPGTFSLSLQHNTLFHIGANCLELGVSQAEIKVRLLAKLEKRKW